MSYPLIVCSYTYRPSSPVPQWDRKRTVSNKGFSSGLIFLLPKLSDTGTLVKIFYSKNLVFVVLTLYISEGSTGETPRYGQSWS